MLVLNPKPLPPVFRQDEKLSRMAGRYTQLLLPGLWFMCMFIVMQVRWTVLLQYGLTGLATQDLSHALYTITTPSQQKSMQARNILMPSVWIMLVRPSPDRSDIEPESARAWPAPHAHR